jgi:hypothetical protein
MTNEEQPMTTDQSFTISGQRRRMPPYPACGDRAELQVCAPATRQGALRADEKLQNKPIAGGSDRAEWTIRLSTHREPQSPRTKSSKQTHCGS